MCTSSLSAIFQLEAKNGADIKLSLDAMEDILRFSHITAVIVVGGDSDFIPLAQKVKAAGRDLIGVGCRQSTNRHWANSCSEFKYYEALVLDPVQKDDVESEQLLLLCCMTQSECSW